MLMMPMNAEHTRATTAAEVLKAGDGAATARDQRHSSNDFVRAPDGGVADPRSAEGNWNLAT